MSAQTDQIIRTLHELGDHDIAIHSQRFFKTGKGEYGEGDKFLGIRVPTLRKCAVKYKEIRLGDALELLTSPFHEARLLALLILVARYSSGSDGAEQKTIYRSYLNHTDFINNWDLVDCSAEHIVEPTCLAETEIPFTGSCAQGAYGSEESALCLRFTYQKA